jgi:hypothetical protein
MPQLSRTDPLTVGYVSAHWLIAEVAVPDLSFSLMAFAEARGYLLRAIHIEHAPTAPTGFQSLVEQLDRERIRTVLVPSLHHLAAVGEPLLIKEHLEHLIGGRVVVTGYAH